AEEWLGRRVVAMCTMSLGGMADVALAPMTGVFDAPPELDDVEAAAFLLPFHTTYLALHNRAGLQAGETLLVVGGASSLGTAAIQLGVAAGAHVIAIAGGPEKGKLCEKPGADGSIRPFIGRRIGLGQVAAALEDHEQRRTSGRTVVDLSLPA